MYISFYNLRLFPFVCMLLSLVLSLSMMTYEKLLKPYFQSIRTEQVQHNVKD